MSGEGTRVFIEEWDMLLMQISGEPRSGTKEWFCRRHVRCVSYVVTTYNLYEN